jgi:hypothetical protein
VLDRLVEQQPILRAATLAALGLQITKLKLYQHIEERDYQYLSQLMSARRVAEFSLESVLHWTKIQHSLRKQPWFKPAFDDRTW